MAVVPAILILSAFVAPASPRRCDFPPRLATFLRAAADIRPGKHSARWEVAADTRQRILPSTASPSTRTRPSSSFPLTTSRRRPLLARDKRGQPPSPSTEQDAVILFDAGKMRYMLWQRYPQLSFQRHPRGDFFCRLIFEHEGGEGKGKNFFLQGG